MKHLKYLRYIIRHKWFVAVACFRRSCPLWRAVKHDWSKFLPSEWIPYAQSFYGPQPRTQETKDKFNKAWLMHQHRNSHHWQHHILRNDDGTTKCLLMSEDDAREMLADWDGAGRAINGKWDTLSWYSKNRDRIQLHEETRAFVDWELGWKPDAGSFPNDQAEPRP